MLSASRDNPRAPMSLTAATRLGAYEILTLMGRGMGVYRARDVLLGRDPRRARLHGAGT
jgi:hypothetical protein